LDHVPPPLLVADDDDDDEDDEDEADDAPPKDDPRRAAVRGLSERAESLGPGTGAGRAFRGLADRDGVAPPRLGGGGDAPLLALVFCLGGDRDVGRWAWLPPACALARASSALASALARRRNGSSLSFFSFISAARFSKRSRAAVAALSARSAAVGPSRCSGRGDWDRAFSTLRASSSRSVRRFRRSPERWVEALVLRMYDGIFFSSDGSAAKERSGDSSRSYRALCS
jgi:hypothetical protein